MMGTLIKTVMITGASSGIGMDLAQRFAKDGHRVAMLARRTDQLDAIVKHIRVFNPYVMSITCDVTQTESVKEAVQKCVDAWGTIDIAIANAGVSLPESGDVMNLDHIERTYQVNVFGVVRLFEAVIPIMRNQKSGHLVSVASLAGLRSAPQAGAYCSSKAALIALTESLRLDLKQIGIHVTLINPGFVVTPMTDQNLFKMPFLLPLEDASYRIYRAISNKVPIFSFPWPMAILSKIATLLPVGLYDKIMLNFKNNKLGESSSSG